MRVLVLTGVPDADQHRRAIRSGASGLVLKEHASDLLIKAVRRVHAGEVWVDRGTTAVILKELRQGLDGRAAEPEAARGESLTAREREIVVLVAQGYGTQKMANVLCISEKTIRNHLVSIYGKLNVSERLELALYAVKHGLAGEPARDI
jgi:DNA-binding NarL/FixJ family response regulator